MNADNITIKRVYEPYNESDGFRILVDRLWPRGVSKENARLNLWLKEIAPSTELRKWFNHEEDKWEEFQKRYKDELKNKTDLLNQLKDISKKNKKITLLFGTRDQEHNEAIVIKQVLKIINN